MNRNHINFRLLNADEIDVRVATVSEKGVSLLLYKDARADMNVLDETVGSLNWTREHNVIEGNLYCTVSVYDEVTKQWVSKQDVGTESFTEKEKGQASDSFKRACFNFGIGRELYTSPFIWVNSNDVSLKQNGQKWTTYDKFTVSRIAYDDKKRIIGLEIKNAKTGKTVFLKKPSA